jgi:hypothetical protein
MEKYKELPHMPEPLIDATAASAYLGFAAITVKRKAHRQELPAIAFPIGSTGKFL